MSCAKHKFPDLKAGFVHKVVHNFAQTVPNLRETLFPAHFYRRRADESVC